MPCVCINSLTLSIGAVTVFATIPLIPPADRSLRNDIIFSLPASLVVVDDGADLHASLVASLFDVVVVVDVDDVDIISD